MHSISVCVFNSLCTAINSKIILINNANNCSVYVLEDSVIVSHYIFLHFDYWKQWRWSGTILFFHVCIYFITWLICGTVCLSGLWLCFPHSGRNKLVRVVSVSWETAWEFSGFLNIWYYSYPGNAADHGDPLKCRRNAENLDHSMLADWARIGKFKKNHGLMAVWFMWP